MLLIQTPRVAVVCAPGNVSIPVTSSLVAISPPPSIEENLNGRPAAEWISELSCERNRKFLWKAMCEGVSGLSPVVIGASVSPSNSKALFTPSQP